MKPLKLLSFVLFAVAGMLTACESEDANPKETGLEREWKPGVIEVSADQRNMVAQSNAFALRTAGQLYEQGDSKSLFFSPMSMGYELGMLLNGADEATARKILATLCLDEGVSTEAINAYYRTLSTTSKNLDKRTTVETENALFMVNGGTFLPDFVEQMKQSYQAYVENVNMPDAEAINHINQWVSGKTHGMIPKALEENEEMAGKALLMNTIYFNGLWYEPFEAKNTSTQPFLTGNGEKTEVQMMHSQRNTGYAETEDYQAVAIPYGNGSWNMVVVLPVKPDGIGALLAKQEWPDLKAMQSGVEVDLYLPKFKTQTDLKSLQDVWFGEESIGGLASVPTRFPKMFPAADGSEFCAFQNAVIEVDEEGTKAAAATWGDQYTFDEPIKQAVFRADHPFLYGIVERSTGAVFFMGVYNGE